MSRREQVVIAWTESDWDDLAAYLGPNADRFRAVYEKGREKAAIKGHGNVAGWSWPALLFGFAWFFYRRQWAVGAVLIVLPLVIGYFFNATGGLTGLAVVMAIYGKSYVVQDAVTRIAKLKADGRTRAELAAAGGVSLAGGVAGGILLALAAIGFLLDKLA